MRSIAIAPLRRHSAILVLGTFVWASTAWADPVTLFFDGVNNEGTSETSALSSGLDILDLDTFAALGVIDVTSQVGADGVVIPPEQAIDPFAITSAWTIESLLSVPVIGDPYLLFATAENRDFTFDNGTPDPGDDVTFTTSYNPAEVGLTVDASDGWAIVQGESGGQTVYYVGISLGNLLEAVGSSTVFDVNYFLLDAFPDNAFPHPNGLDQVVALPQLDLLVAFNVVPEPGTGLLVGLGLLGLAGSRRGRR
jgi:hypothetical protein